MSSVGSSPNSERIFFLLLDWDDGLFQRPETVMFLAKSSPNID